MSTRDFEFQVPAQIDDLTRRLAVAEQRLADLEAGIAAYSDAWDRFSQDDDFDAVVDAVAALRALVGDETPGTGEHA